MTEAEWLGSIDPIAMLEWLCYVDPADQQYVTRFPRKVRLCACACCRRIWHMLNDPRLQNAVIASEQFADGLVTAEQLFQVEQQAVQPYYEAEVVVYSHAEQSANEVAMRRCSAAQAALHTSSRHIHGTAISVLMNAAIAATGPKIESMRSEKFQQAALVRDIFGNPFRPVTVDPTWRTSTVVSLAEAIYTDRAFDRLPILADALEDAGCDNADMLNHCRQSGEHVRGCWVVDLILSKDR